MTNDNLLGKQLDEYRLEMLLGKGGMARVYRAVDVRLGRYVAIKVIDTPFRADSDYTMRFEREARAIGRLEHPNIVRLYRYGEVNGLLYMAMQYVEGTDLHFVLDDYIRDQEVIKPKDASPIIRQICQALDFAHIKGVIHRDVKPSNILLNKQGHAMLTDFGLALLTEIGTHGEIFGSPYYIAPEQAISSAGAVPQSDLYAVGVVLYEILTGEVPFDAEDPLDIAAMHMTEEPPSPRDIRPEISPALEAMMLKALAKETGDRYPNGAALAASLDQAVKKASADVPPPSSPTVSHPTIPNRVASEVAAHPLPPIPAAVAASPPRRARPRSAASPTVLSERTRHKTGKRLLTEIGAGAGIGLFLAGVLIAVLVMVGRNSVSERIEDLSPTDEAALVISASESIIVHDLLLTRGGDNGEDSLFIVNLTDEAFPLASLRLGDGSGAINGAEWGIDVLQSGACVTVWRDSGNSQPPPVTCEEVGEHLIRKESERFWASAFNVYYGGELVGSCAQTRAQCPITIFVDNAK